MSTFPIQFKGLGKKIVSLLILLYTKLFTMTDKNDCFRQKCSLDIIVSYMFFII